MSRDTCDHAKERNFFFFLALVTQLKGPSNSTWLFNRFKSSGVCVVTAIVILYQRHIQRNKRKNEKKIMSLCTVGNQSIKKFTEIKYL